MKHQIIKVIGEKYYLNNHQWFVFQDTELKKQLEEIKFPAIVLDTEFFNQSHNKLPGDVPQLYDKKNPSLVYVLQYSFVRNLKEIYLRSNRKAIKSLTIKRQFKDSKYDFHQQYQALTKSFIQMCQHKKIQTIIVAGASNDAVILRQWVNLHKNLLRKNSDGVFSLTKDGTINVKTFDVYRVLEKTMAFSNFKSNGEPFSAPKSLKKGYFSPETLQIPSLKKFFEYFAELYETEFFEDNADIYELCVSALKLFTCQELTTKQYNSWSKDVKKAKKHCFNDVLKTLYLLKFWYSLTALKPTENKYLDLESTKTCENV